LLAIQKELSDECHDRGRLPPQRENLAMIPSNNSAATLATHDATPSRVPTKRAGKASTKGKADKPTNALRHGSKTAKIISLLKRPGGAALEQLQKATGWQAHSGARLLKRHAEKEAGATHPVY
jgi:Protein of unknown function (DUF3489)